jgi:hypothetical protein
MATEFLSTYYSSSAHSLRRRLGTGAILFGKQESLDIITTHLQNIVELFLLGIALGFLTV